MESSPSNQKSRRKIFTSALVSICAFGMFKGSAALAEASASKPSRSAAQLTELLHSPSVGARALSASVVGTGPAVTVLAEEKDTATDQNLRIDAVFFAKALIEGAPGQIEKVKVLFSQTGKPVRYVNVSSGEITEYGAGRLSAQQLLDSLPLVSVDQYLPDLSDGPEVGRRILAWKRIDKLRSQGTGVSPFETIFKEIQGLAKANDAEKVSQRLTYLESKLSGQEEQVKQARDSLRGRGVPAVKTASNTTAAAPPPTGAPPGAATGAAPNSAGSYIPPEAEHLKSVMSAQGNEIVSQVMRKNSSEGYRLQAMKKQIEDLFAAHDDAKAYQLIHAFDLAATKVLGTSNFGPGGGNQGGGMGPGGGGMGPGGGGMGPGGGGPPF